MPSAEAATAFRRLWSGRCSHVPLSLFRIGLASVVLVRCADWLRPWLTLDHHAFTRGAEFWPALEAVQQPRLHSPLLPMPELPEALSAALVLARSLLALLLLLGVRTRACAFALFVVGGSLMAADRYRYFHHTYLLWLSCLWLSLCQAPGRWSVTRFWSAQDTAPSIARWSLQLLRAQCLIVYAAAGIAKLDVAWLSGSAITRLVHARLVGGPLWQHALALLGTRGIALSVCLVELALTVLLAVPRLRLVGVALGLSFHAMLSASMFVSTFSAQMALYLLLFLPWPPPADEHQSSMRKYAATFAGR